MINQRAIREHLQSNQTVSKPKLLHLVCSFVVWIKVKVSIIEKVEFPVMFQLCLSAIRVIDEVRNVS